MKKKILTGMMCLVAMATVATFTSCDTEYVDLGLPSGTKWKTVNEPYPNDAHGFYTYDEAMEKFGSNLPTKEQFEELEEKCIWTWDDTKQGYQVTGPNGNSIFLPASGFRGCDGGVNVVGSYGYYWSSTPDGSDIAWYLGFDSGGVDIGHNFRCCGLSVRLVQD